MNVVYHHIISLVLVVKDYLADVSLRIALVMMNIAGMAIKTLGMVNVPKNVRVRRVIREKTEKME